MENNNELAFDIFLKNFKKSLFIRRSLLGEGGVVENLTKKRAQRLRVMPLFWMLDTGYCLTLPVSSSW